MRGFYHGAALALVLASGACAAASADLTLDGAKELIAGVDALRQPPGALDISATLRTMQNGKEVDADRYAIKSDGGGNALMTMLNPDKRGQKILNTDAGVWIYFPKTRRPIRLTPMQQLHGSASIGDILQVRWSSAYRVGGVEQQVEVKGQPCKLIRLDAARDDSAYARIELYVDAARHEPVRADLYTFGGKLLKTAWYDAPSVVNGRRIIAGVRIATALDSKSNKETLYTVSAMNATKVDSEQFTLRALEVGR